MIITTTTTTTTIVTVAQTSSAIIAVGFLIVFLALREIFNDSEKMKGKIGFLVSSLNIVIAPLVLVLMMLVFYKIMMI